MSYKLIEGFPNFKVFFTIVALKNNVISPPIYLNSISSDAMPHKATNHFLRQLSVQLLKFKVNNLIIANTSQMNLHNIRAILFDNASFDFLHFMNLSFR